MRDGQDRAVEVVERALQHLDRGDVEVVGRLVEDEEVRLGQHQPGDLEAALLAAAQLADRGEGVLVAEQEPLQDADRPLLADRPQRRHELERRPVGRQRLLLLGVVAEHDAGADLERAAVERLLAGHRPQQGGLAAAVRPDDPDPLAVAHDQVERPEQDPARRRCATGLLALEHVLAAAGGVERDLDALAPQDRPLGGGRPGPLDPLGHALGARGELRVHRGPVLELPQRRLEPLQLVPLDLVELVSAQQPALALVDVVAVVAGVLLEAAVLDLDDPARRPGRAGSGRAR